MPTEGQDDHDRNLQADDNLYAPHSKGVPNAQDVDPHAKERKEKLEQYTREYGEQKARQDLHQKHVSLRKQIDEAISTIAKFPDQASQVLRATDNLNLKYKAEILRGAIQQNLNAIPSILSAMHKLDKADQTKLLPMVFGIDYKKFPILAEFNKAQPNFTGVKPKTTAEKVADFKARYHASKITNKGEAHADTDPSECIARFNNVHERLYNNAFRLKKTYVHEHASKEERPEDALKAIIKHAMEGKNRSRDALVELGWMEKNGKINHVDANVPQAVKDAEFAIQHQNSPGLR